MIYINDLTASTSNDFTGGISLFADDTKVYSTNIIELQNSLHSISSWLNKFQLDLAPKKCFNLQIGKSRKENNNCNNTIFINNVKITTKQVIKDLGVFISYNLKWEYHINYIVKIASSYSYLIFKSFNTSNIWILIKLYKTYVRSKLEYNTVVWSPYLLKDINKIEKIQKRFTKLACCRCLIRFSNYKDRLTKLNLKSLQHRRLIFDLILLYKIINNLSDLNFHDYFKFKNSNYILRSHNLQIEAIYSFKTKQLGSSYFNRVVNPWNSLPVDIVNSLNLTVFKSRINRHDVSNLLHWFIIWLYFFNSLSFFFWFICLIFVCQFIFCLFCAYFLFCFCSVVALITCHFCFAVIQMFWFSVFLLPCIFHMFTIFVICFFVFFWCDG